MKHRWMPLLIVTLSMLACDAGRVGSTSDGATDGPRDADTRPECTRDEDCSEGVCTGGRCCPEADACGEQCCNANQQCFANACVVPGETCTSSADCEEGEYCEPSLGADGGATQQIDAGHACLQPVPKLGRCLALPPRCPENGGNAAADAGTCFPACEYHPPAGKLNAIKEWSWNATNAKTFTDHVDVWSTPVVARVTDTNCDGKVDELDPPNIIFVSGDGMGTQCAATTTTPTTCHTGVLRVLDGASGQEVWSLRRAEADSVGFAAMSIAAADLDRDGRLEIVAVTGEGFLVVIDHRGELLLKGDQALPGAANNNFGWGGSLAIGDMNGDGAAEIAFGKTLFSTVGGQLKWVFTGEGSNSALSILSDVDEDGQLELIAGRAAYKYDGTMIWQTEGLPNGLLPGVGDFDGDGAPEVALVGRYPRPDDTAPYDRGKLWVVDGKTGNLVAGPLILPDVPGEEGAGGPPTVADFDGDDKAEIGVANANYYSVTKVNLALPNVADRLTTLWKQINHDLSSSVTGSTVFDFEGDGKAEVVYNDECYLWVYDGTTGDVRFATQTTSFTANEASLVADVDGDGRAEMVMIANRASPTKWKCDIEPWISDDPVIGRPAWVPPGNGETAYSGITVWGGRGGSWVGTRKLWNQHSYHVTNVCDSRDSACAAGDNVYGAIPRVEQRNWELPWLNNFRQNVQDKGLFDAPDPTVTLGMKCPHTLVATVRNVGLALLPAGVEVGFYVIRDGQETQLGTATTTTPLFPGQGVEVSYVGTTADNITTTDVFVARILVDPNNTIFNECRPENNESEQLKNRCTLG